jgi:putative Holliday junction resolvase
MPRILAFDYGNKRTGLAVTDTNQIIATGLATVLTKDIVVYLKNYLSKEEVICFVVGEPKKLNNTTSQLAKPLNAFINLLKKNFPDMPLERHDERYTSKMASRALRQSGLTKKDRQDKGLVDMTAAIIILQSYMEYKENSSPK